MERVSSVVECRTRNQVSPDSNPLCYRFEKSGHFRSLHWRPCSLSCINEYLAIDSGVNVSDLVLAGNWCLARMRPEEAELVSEWTGPHFLLGPYSISQKVITLSGRRFITVSGVLLHYWEFFFLHYRARITVSGVYYIIGWYTTCASRRKETNSTTFKPPPWPSG